jgi:hypothetical protein
MDARPLLEQIAAALAGVRLEAILIGNAAAALRGAPVTTVDFDFLFRVTPGNLRKLKAFAKAMGASIGQTYEGVSTMYRIVSSRIGLQADFLSTMHGVRSFESLRTRCTSLDLGSGKLLVASLDDIFKSKSAANRPKDRAVLDVLRETIDEARKAKARKKEA